MQAKATRSRLITLTDVERKKFGDVAGFFPIESLFQFFHALGLLCSSQEQLSEAHYFLAYGLRIAVEYSRNVRVLDHGHIIPKFNPRRLSADLGAEVTKRRLYQGGEFPLCARLPTRWIRPHSRSRLFRQVSVQK